MKPHRPYASRSVHELTYIASILRQRGDVVPVDLEAALVGHGIDVSSI